MTAASAADCALVERIVNTLDRDDVEGEIECVSLTRLTGDEAVALLDTLLARSDRLSRVAVAADPRGHAVLVRGERARVDFVLRVLATLERAAHSETVPPRTRARGEYVVERLASIEPEASISAARELLPKRVVAETTAIALGPGLGLGIGIAIAGDAANVDLWRDVIGTLQPGAGRGARLLRLAAPDAARVIGELRAEMLADDQRRLAFAGLVVELDPAARELVLIGPPPATSRALQILRKIDGPNAVERETRFTRAEGDPRAIAALMTELSVRHGESRPDEGTRCVPVAPLGAVLFSAAPDVVARLETVVASASRRADGAIAARRLPISVTDASALVERASNAAEAAAASRGARHESPSLDLDVAGATLLASGDADAIDALETSLQEIRGLRQAFRSTRLLVPRERNAAMVAEAVTRMLGAPVPVDSSRSVPVAAIASVPSLGAVVVSGEPAQIELRARLAALLEENPAITLVPWRILEIRCDEPEKAARAIAERFDARSGEDRLARPVFAAASTRGGALAVALHADLLADVAALIDSVIAQPGGATIRPREIFSSTLVQSDVRVVARALNELFAADAAPRDAAGRELPHMQPPRELHVSADPASRMIWVEAARDRTLAIDGLVKVLDRLAIAPSAQLRLFRLEKGDIPRVVQSLRDLAARGLLASAMPEGGVPPAVTIDADPASRTVVVVGDAAACSKSEEVLRQLGLLAAPSGTRVIDAAGVNPDQLVARARKEAFPGELADAASGVATIVDSARGVVRAFGGTEQVARLASVAQEMVRRQSDDWTTLAVPVECADAGMIAAAIDSIGSARASASSGGGASAGRIAISGRRDDVLLARAAASALDARDSIAPRVLLALACKDPATLSEVIEQHFSARDEDARRARPVAIRPGADGASVIIATHPDLLSPVIAAARDLGSIGEIVPTSQVVSVIPLRHARAEALARLFDTELAGEDDARSAAVRADPASNSLVIATKPARAAMIAALADALDQPGVADSRVIRAWRADARLRGRIASAVTSIAPDARVSFDDVAGITVVVHGPSEAGAIDAALRTTDGVEAVGAEMRLIPVRAERIERAARTLRALLAESAGTPTSDGTVEPAFAVGVDPDARRLLVEANPARASIAERLVSRFVAESAAATEALRIRTDDLACVEIPVANVDAEVAARTIEMMLADQVRWPAELLARLRAGDAVARPRATADSEASRVFVVGAPSLVARTIELLPLLDKSRGRTSDDARARDERWELRVYPVGRDALKPAVAAVEQALAARTPKGVPPPVDLVEVSDGDALVASGEPSWLDAIDSAIRSIDARGPRDAARLRVVAVHHVSAIQLAAVVEPLVDLTRRETPDAVPEASEFSVRAVPDPKAGAVALIATPTALDVAEEILAELDGAAAPGAARTIRLYELEAGEAASVAKSITDRFETEEGDDPLPLVRVQSSRNSLLVRATDKQRGTIDAIVAKADPDAPTRARALRTISIDRGRAAREIARTIARLDVLGPRVALALDEPANAVVLFGAQGEMARIEGIALQVASCVEEPGRAPRDFELPASAEPRGMAALARAALGQVGTGAADGSSELERGAASRIVLADRPGSRVIACIASESDAGLVKALLANLARGQNVEPIAIRRCALLHADAERVAGALRARRSRDEGALSVVIEADARTLVLIGAPREVQSAADVAARLDRRSPCASELRIAPLRVLRASDAAALIRAASPVDAPAPAVSDEPMTNTVLVRGSIEEIVPAAELLGRLDEPAPKELSPFEAVRVSPLIPSEVAAFAQAQVAGADESRRDRLRLIASDALGVLFVRADPALLDEVRQAIRAACGEAPR